MTPAESIPNPKETKITQEIEALASQVFPEDITEPIMGMTDKDIVAPNIYEMVNNPENTLATLLEDNKVVGFSLAVPIGKMDTTRTAESAETAYIYFSGIELSRQGKGLVKTLLDTMMRKLVDRGYSFAERHSVLTQDYADNVEKTYAGAVVEKRDGVWWPEVGPERFFRIDLSKVEL